MLRAAFAILVSAPLLILQMHHVILAASVIDPKVKFEFEPIEDSTAKICQLFIILITYPQPEGVNLRVLGAFTKETGNIYYGFSVDVGETPISHGIPRPPLKKPISSASILSDIFVSTNTMNPINPGDGGYTAVANSPTNAKQFISLIMRGDYLVMFRRIDLLEETTYAVHPAPPPDLVQKFLSCAKDLGR
jgi:hypothetical protein